MKYAILLLLVLAVACSASDTESPETGMPVPGDEADDMIEVIENGETVYIPKPGSPSAGPDVVYRLEGDNFNFYLGGVVQPELQVRQGQKVRIEFTSIGGFHDWVLDEFSAATEKVRDGEGMTAVEFIAEEQGIFEYYCSVGSHRANGMWGNLVVT